MGRNYLIDNCKALLIFLVVVGHLVTLGPRGNSEFWHMAWVAIYAFHMPAFMFLSGVFAKPTGEAAGKSALSLFVSYLLITLLVWLAHLVIGDRFAFRLVTPVFSAWFLLSLMTMRLLLPALSHIRGAMVALVAISLLVPLNGDIGSVFSLARTAYFLPFFFAGYLMGVKGIDGLRKQCSRWLKAVLVAIALMALIGTVLLSRVGILPMDALWAKSTYLESGFPSWQVGMAMRCFMMVVAALCIVALLVALPTKKKPFTYIGKNSLSVYILQAPVIVILPHFHTGNYLVLGWVMVAASILFCALAAAPPVHKVISYPSQLAVRFLHKTDAQKAKAKNTEAQEALTQEVEVVEAQQTETQEAVGQEVEAQQAEMQEIDPEAGMRAGE